VAKPSISVVIPVFNESASLPETIESLLAAVKEGDFETEIVLVDDGSTDHSAAVARRAVADRAPLRIVSQPNLGRFEARRRGVEAAESDWVLLLDGRVQIDAGSLAYVRNRLERAPVWTAHVDIDAEGDLLGTFWKLIAELAWSDYFDDPRETSFGPENFDRYPKGTTCFLAPRQLLLDAIGAFHSRYTDLRDANDDTPLLRWMADREPIHVAPGFRCLYRPRTSLDSFVRHSVHRGVVFVDGHGRRESRFFPAMVAFYPASVALAAATIRRPTAAPAALLALAAGASLFGIARRRSPLEVASLGLLTPVYGMAHGLGMWRGLVTIIDERLRPRGDDARP
jgi:glycosyltransferase involved in cell wall biosynthesis